MNILFMCVANSARSQLAEGLAAHILGPETQVQSAGSQPGTLNPFAVLVMREVGVDISHQFSKSVDQLPARFVADLDYVITLCAEEVCPMIIAPRAKRLHWPFPDPASKEVLPEPEMVSRFRNTRELLSKALTKFKSEMKL